MSEGDDPAQRYLALWMQYLTALLADPQAMETLKRWESFTRQFSYPAAGSAQRNEVPFPIWPPFFGPLATSPASSGDADASASRVAALERRVNELERRLAELEPRPKASSSRKRSRKSRT